MKKILNIVLAVVLTAGGSTLSAKVKLPALVGDGMVLQRGMAVPVWGWAEPGEKVEVLFNGETYLTTTGQDGRWQVALTPAKAGGPHRMTIRGEENQIEVKDILYGDVWLCAGQSNMYMKMRELNDAYELREEDNFPRIRHLDVGLAHSNKPLNDIASIGWRPAIPVQLPAFSAVAYFFAKELYKRYDVPIGLISCSWGGSTAQAWVSLEGLEGFPHYAKRFRQVSDPSFEPTETFRPHHEPTLPYNGMLHPIIGYGIKGVIWYQGESNVDKAEEYKTLLPAMVADWRGKWGQGDFPFLFVQLAGYKAYNPDMAESQWAGLRDAQLDNLSMIPNSGMAVIFDIGEADDIHPKNKWDVGKRLALVARKVAYGDKKVVYSGPIYRSMKIDGKYAVIEFDHTGSGLTTRCGDTLQGFFISEDGRHFFRADARIEKNRVVVSNPEVLRPKAVRYAWQDNPQTSNLINKEGLPASPFKTDK